MPIEPYFREAGAGPAVVCLHSNASSSTQWRGLMDLLAPKFRVLAADGYGAGKSPAWPADHTVMLEDEVNFLAPVLERAGKPFALVGHSYGGAIALKAALMHRADVKAVALYEPTLFSLLEAESQRPNDADGIRIAASEAAECIAAGDKNAAAERFIDYWMGKGAWAQTPEQRKPAIAESMVNVRHWSHALLNEPAPLEAFRELDIPVLYMTGTRSTAAAHGVARILAAALPRVEVHEFDKLGHMGPVTHPDTVNPVIASFLERT